MKTYTVRAADGSRPEVQGYAYGDFGVHKAMNRAGTGYTWTVDHIPSGYAIRNWVKKIAEARDLAKYLQANTAVTWDGAGKVPKAFLESCGDAYKAWKQEKTKGVPLGVAKVIQNTEAAVFSRGQWYIRFGDKVSAQSGSHMGLDNGSPRLVSGVDDGFGDDVVNEAFASIVGTCLSGNGAIEVSGNSKRFFGILSTGKWSKI